MRKQFQQAGLTSIPFAHVVLGSGYAVALQDYLAQSDAWSAIGQFHFKDVPGLKQSTVEGHLGHFEILKSKQGRVVLMQVGRLHGYEGHSAKDIVLPVMTSRALGVKNYILTNSSGSLNPKYKAGDVMVIRDQVNLTAQNPLVGANPVNPETKEFFGPRFPDLRELYAPRLRQQLSDHCRIANLNVHEGTYLGLLGPSFETPAEVRLFSSWGLDAVGMSTVWEAIALGHSGATIGGVALISNVGCGLEGDTSPLDHHQILETSKKTAFQVISAILSLMERWEG